jgi:hypothetical protein
LEPSVAEHRYFPAAEARRRGDAGIKASSPMRQFETPAAALLREQAFA